MLEHQITSSVDNRTVYTPVENYVMALTTTPPQKATVTIILKFR